MRLLLSLSMAALLVPAAHPQGRTLSGLRRVGGSQPGVEFQGPPPPIFRASSAPGELDGNGECKHPSISPCGRYVAFETDSSNLGIADVNLQRDVYLRDRDPDDDGELDEPGQIAYVLISVASNGLQASASSFDPSVSENGRHVCFTSAASNLVFGDTNMAADILVRDRDADGDGIFDEPGESTTTRISVSSAGTEANGDSSLAKISADGRTVVFESFADNLYQVDSNGQKDVFFHDRDPDGNGFFDEGNGVTVRVSTSMFGQAGNDMSSNPSVSATGRLVVFESRASDLVAGDLGTSWDIFVHDRDPDENGVFDEGNETLTRLSLAPGGAPPNGDSRRPHITPDGRHVVFESAATNLGPFDANGVIDIYALDRDPDANGILDEGNQVIRLMSVNNSGVLANDNCIWARTSWSGRYVAYVSFARNLSPLDHNFTFDVFARDRDPDGNGVFDEGNGVTLLLSRISNHVGDMLSGNGEISADGRYKTFATDATNLNSNGHDRNGLRDIYVRQLY
jgi:Tol biopolymer transport system component